MDSSAFLDLISDGIKNPKELAVPEEYFRTCKALTVRATATNCVYCSIQLEKTLAFHGIKEPNF